MKSIKRIVIKYLSILTIIVLSMFLFSCTRLSVNVNINGLINVSTKSNANINNTENVVENKNTKEIGPKLVELEENIFTLSHYKLPKVGDILYGFRVKAIYDYESRNAKLV